MRSRKKILLMHGVSEDRKLSDSAAVVKVLSNHLKMPDLELRDISRCQRLGTVAADKPRPILVKFRELSLRNQIWYAKTNLKNTGITLSEFLTKSRHETFMAARKRFGINKCWTKEGYVIVIGPDGKRHTVSTCTELDNIHDAVEAQPTSKAPAAGSTASDSRTKPLTQASRAKRIVKK